MSIFNKMFHAFFISLLMTVFIVSTANAIPHPVKFSLILPRLARLEADYILACQYLDIANPAHGAINNIYGNPTWVVPLRQRCVGWIWRKTDTRIRQEIGLCKAVYGKGRSTRTALRAAGLIGVKEKAGQTGGYGLLIPRFIRLL